MDASPGAANVAMLGCMTRRRIPTQFLSVALALAGCGDDPPPTTAAPRVEAVRTDTKSDAATPAVAADAPPEVAAAPLVRSTAAAPGKAKAAGQLGFDLVALSQLYAIEATALSAGWSNPGLGAPSAMRDDDLGTAWRCNHAAEQHCAAGLSFAEPSTVHSVRLFAAAGPRWNEFRGHPRPKRIRVHTDAGWFDATVEDGATHHYVNLTPPVTTRTLAVEVLEVHAGKKDKELWFGELEAFGSTGPTRPPLELDPSRVVISFETEAWKTEGTSNTIRLAFAEELENGGEARGTSRRIMRATAIHGDADDRVLVIERRFGSDCVTARGSYLLLDRNTRVLFPLGDKGSVPADVTLRADGMGAMFVRGDDDERARALVRTDDVMVRHQPKTKAGESTAQLAARLAFVGQPVARGGAEPGAALAGCTVGTADAPLLARIGTALDLPGLRGEFASICALEGGSKAVVGTDGAACGPRWVAAVVAPSGEIVAQNLAGDGDGDGAHFATIPGLGVVLEGTRGGGATSDLWLLEPTGIRLLVKGGALAVRDPKLCRPCAQAVPVAQEPAAGDDGADAGDGSAVAPAPDDEPAPNDDPAPDDAPSTDTAALPSVDEDAP